MKSKIIDEVVCEVIDNSNHSQSFKNAFKQYIYNKFNGNVTDNDFKTVLNMLDDLGVDDE